MKIREKVNDFMSRPVPKDGLGKVLFDILSIFSPIIIIPGLIVVGIFVAIATPYWAAKDFINWVWDHFRPESDFEYVEEFEES